MSAPARKPAAAASIQRKAREQDYGELMREMGSINGSWNPEPDDHITGLLREDVDLSPNEIKLIAYVKSHCVRPKLGGLSAWGRTPKGQPLTLARICEYFGWNSGNASGHAKRPLAYGFIRQNQQGVFGLGAKVEGTFEGGEDKAKDKNDAVCTYSIPIYLLADSKRLSEIERKNFLQGWVAKKEAAKERLNQVVAEQRRAEFRELQEHCRSYGLDLREGKKRRQSGDANSQKTNDDEKEMLYVHIASVQTGSVHTAPPALYSVDSDSVHTAHIRSSLNSQFKELINSGETPPTTPNSTPDSESPNGLRAAVMEALHRSQLRVLGPHGKTLDERTLVTLCNHLQPLADDPAAVKEILAEVEAKCVFLAAHPAEAHTKNWGYIVGIVKAQVKDRRNAVHEQHEQVLDLAQRKAVGASWRAEAEEDLRRKRQRLDDPATPEWEKNILRQVFAGTGGAQ